MIKVWYCNVTELYDPEAFERGMKMLPWDERREKVFKYRFMKDSCLCLGAGLLAAYALRDAGASDLRIARTEHDKPYLIGYPDIHFNISHSGRIAVCAVSDQPVGADVEELRVYDKGVAELAFTAQENDWILACEDKDTAFTRLWTRKESYLKMTGEGIAYSLKDISLIPGEAQPEGYIIREYSEEEHLISICSAYEFAGLHETSCLPGSEL
jgi:4'-phosphopantetheinyl transferase